MKSKTKLFLLPIMAVAVLAFAIAGFATFNNAPEKVSAATDTRVYFYNAWGWDHIYAYAWNGGDNSGWDAHEITANVEIYNSFSFYYFEFDSTEHNYTQIIFHNQYDGNADKTEDITIVNGAYYYNNGSTDSKYKAAYFKDETATVNYYKPADFGETVYFYDFIWLSSDHSGDTHCMKLNGDWAGANVTASKDGNWYSATTNKYATFIFNDNNEHQSSSLTYTADYTYYYNGTWYKSAQQVEMKKAQKWYIIGAINGAAANWNDSTYACDDDDDSNKSLENKAEWYNVTLKAGDLIKVVHGNDAPDYTGQWKNCAAEAGVNTVDGSGNGVIMFDGVYNIYLNKAGDAVYINYAQEGLMGAAANGKYQFSTDGTYLLLAAALNPTSDMTAVSPAHTYKVGYVLLDGVDTDHDSNTFYDAIVLKLAAGGTARHTAYNLYSNHDYDDYKVLAFEIAKPAVSGTYQIYVKCDGEKIAAKTINVTVA